MTKIQIDDDLLLEDGDYLVTEGGFSITLEDASYWVKLFVIKARKFMFNITE